MKVNHDGSTYLGKTIINLLCVAPFKAELQSASQHTNKVQNYSK